MVRALRTSLVSLILALVLIAPFGLSAAPAAAEAGCCIDKSPNDPQCFESTNLEQECAAQTQTPHPDALCTSYDDCRTFCCCAKDDADFGRGIRGFYGPDGWNRFYDSKAMPMIECKFAGDLGSTNFVPKPLSADCSVVCTSTGSGMPPQNSNVSAIGLVKDADDEPLANVTVFIPQSNSFNWLDGWSAKSIANGSYVIAGIPKGLRSSVYAFKDTPGCQAIAQTQKIEFSNDPTTVPNITLVCGGSSCTQQNKPKFAQSPRVIPGTPDVLIPVSLEDDCNMFNGIYVVTFEHDLGGGQRQFRVLFRGDLNKTFTYGPLQPNTEYTVYLQALFTGGIGIYPALRGAEHQTLQTGDAICMDAHDRKWCDNTGSSPGVLSCGNDNKVVRKNCTRGQYCVKSGSGATADAWCISWPQCDACNGLFGLLATVANVNFETVLSGASKVQCTNQGLSQYCIRDRTTKVVDGYRSCTEIARCEDYAGEDSCAANTCGILGGCSWHAVEGLEELGMGICTSQHQPAACSSCKDLFGTCNQQLCEAIGSHPASPSTPSDCYWDASEGSISYNTLGIEKPRCIHKDEVSCAIYDTQEDCVGTSSQNPGQGATPRKFDIHYDGNGKRDRGTHARSGGGHHPSADRYGLGTCAWSEGYNYCYADADMRLSGSTPIDDCRDYGGKTTIVDTYGLFECLADNEPPVTNIVMSGPASLADMARTPVVVTDNLYGAGDIETHFCFQAYDRNNPPPDQDKCYPKQSLSDAINTAYQGTNVGESGQYLVRFYSWDPSGNVEILDSSNEIVVTLINTGLPDIENAVLT